MSEDSDEIMNEVLKEAIKDLLVNKPFMRTERLDRVSSTILGTVGVILTISIGVFSLVIEKSATTVTKVILFLACLAFVLSLMCLIASIRSREVTMSRKINAKSYFALLRTISRLNDKKKALQNKGLIFLILGATMMLVFLLFWILGV